MKDCIEVWDMRMFKRTKVIPWEGTGSEQEQLFDDMNLDEFAPETDLEEEAKSNRPISEASQRLQLKASGSETTAQTKPAGSKYRQVTSS